MLRHRAKNFDKCVSGLLGACFVNMWHLALHWDGSHEPWLAGLDCTCQGHGTAFG
jgi:hypothetical protein